MMADRKSKRLFGNRIGGRPHTIWRKTVYKPVPSVAWRFLSALARLFGVS